MVSKGKRIIVAAIEAREVNIHEVTLLAEADVGEETIKEAALNAITGKQLPAGVKSRGILRYADNISTEYSVVELDEEE